MQTILHMHMYSCLPTSRLVCIDQLQLCERTPPQEFRMALVFAIDW
jgi:hypothetical protein